MKGFVKALYYSFPVQLLFLHFKKYQVLLIFWYVLFATVQGSFLKPFGANSLFLSPEYLGNVNSLSAGFVGVAVGIFIMSWNISTFILHSKQFRFLAATVNPFLKYCINNAIIPIIFLIYYFFKAYQFLHNKELISNMEIVFIVGGFIFGFCLLLAVSMIYFFQADKAIFRTLVPIISNPRNYITHLQPGVRNRMSNQLKVKWYFDSPFHIHATRNVDHYTDLFVDSLFKRHHISAILSILTAFFFLIASGFFLDYPLLQIPAAASITIFFAILIGVSGAFAYLLQSWGIPFLAAIFVLLNILFNLGWIDVTNKAYGLNYDKQIARPEYSKRTLDSLCSPLNIRADMENMTAILDKWKLKQPVEKPYLVLVNTSGGGNRSATFTMNVLQHMDSITGGNFMQQVFLINGASGGMIGATYFRELYYQRLKGNPIRVQAESYVNDISGDLLNPLFSSYVVRDILSPAQKFTFGPYSYLKDRGYAFEQALNTHTNGFLNKPILYYKQPEQNATIPLIFFNSIITRDARKLVVSTQPVRFMMKPFIDTAAAAGVDADAVDFCSFFSKQDPYNLRVLTAMRMNATFPAVLPNVWLPSYPVIDVMDAGLRDNYGQESTVRFIHVFENWIKQNTKGVIIFQIKDRASGAWEYPYESSNIADNATKPFLLLQHNWFKMMEFFQNDQLTYLAANNTVPIHKILISYKAEKKEQQAAINFHLTKSEKENIGKAIFSTSNTDQFAKYINLIKQGK